MVCWNGIRFKVDTNVSVTEVRVCSVFISSAFSDFQRQFMDVTKHQVNTRSNISSSVRVRSVLEHVVTVVVNIVERS